MGKILIPLN